MKSELSEKGKIGITLIVLGIMLTPLILITILIPDEVKEAAKVSQSNEFGLKEFLTVLAWLVVFEAVSRIREKRRKAKFEKTIAEDMKLLQEQDDQLKSLRR